MEWCFHSNKTIMSKSGVWEFDYLLKYGVNYTRFLAWAPSCSVLLTTWPGDRRAGLASPLKGWHLWIWVPPTDLEGFFLAPGCLKQFKFDSCGPLGSSLNRSLMKEWLAPWKVCKSNNPNLNTYSSMQDPKSSKGSGSFLFWVFAKKAICPARPQTTIKPKKDAEELFNNSLHVYVNV